MIASPRELDHAATAGSSITRVHAPGEVIPAVVVANRLIGKQWQLAAITIRVESLDYPKNEVVSAVSCNPQSAIRNPLLYPAELYGDKTAGTLVFSPSNTCISVRLCVKKENICVPVFSLDAEGRSMARLARAEMFVPNEAATVHVMNRVVRRCFLFGDDPVSGKNFDHRKVWFETLLIRLAASFGIDLLGFSVMSNHFHLILRSRPDVVAEWSDTEVARRWLRETTGTRLFLRQMLASLFAFA